MENIEKLLEMLPEGYEAAAKETGAFGRKREITSVYDLLMLVFLYVAHGLSNNDEDVLIIVARPMSRDTMRCPLCGKRCKGYDSSRKKFRQIPLYLSKFTFTIQTHVPNFFSRVCLDSLQYIS